jgi:uncharacterized protein (TIGR02145 family)
MKRTTVITATSLFLLAVLLAAGISEAQVRSTAPAAVAAAPAPNTFTDSRDGQTYRTVRIGTQTWMAQNLNYAGGDDDVSVCYDNDPDNCATYGRLYDWATVMGFESSCNEEECASQIQSPHQGICPAGWRLPTRQDWNDLVRVAGGGVAGRNLKSTSGWLDDMNGTDDFGFSALPGGIRSPDGSFFGGFGYWWSVTESGDGNAWRRNMEWGYVVVDENVSRKGFGLSVRCLQN